jgi:hypothetical protein
MYDVIHCTKFGGCYMESDFTLLVVCHMYHVEWQKYMYSVGPMALHGVICAHHVIQEGIPFRGQIGPVTKLDGWMHANIGLCLGLKMYEFL